ncbi:hypothetical protein BP5796_01815 [Coleophoma crateriformis]|uniref:Glycoside hydrolase n=1 Tax=Coleophoma crateriformis TaxID=565419 RepID=A0A3D8T1X0_9HELO|nr:hypothetical protein BP5796_01815 [Coleophoma crateriformis]
MGGLPQAAVTVSVVVLIYSFICLVLTVLLTFLLWTYGERWTYVALLTIFTSISTLGSFVQQLHYVSDFTVIKEAQFQKALASLDTPALGFGGSAEIGDVVLYWIQFYCYNVMSLMVLFWTVALFSASWGLKTDWLGVWRLYIGPGSKAFGILFPTIVVGLGNCKAVIENPALAFISQTILMFFSLTAGGVLLVMILFKYIKTRRLTMKHSYRSPWWASHNSKSVSSSTGMDASETNATFGTTESEAISARQSTYDRALVTRFTIGFVILAVFEVAIIMFTLVQSDSSASIAAAGHPNFTASGAIVDICLFIPGASASLVVFLVFGTTKSWRQYWTMIVGGCGARSKLQNRSLVRRTRYATEQSVRMDTFERLPSITNEGRSTSKGTVPINLGLDFDFEGTRVQDTTTIELSDSSDDEVLRLPIQSPGGSVKQPQHQTKTSTVSYTSRIPSNSPV